MSLFARALVSRAVSKRWPSPSSVPRSPVRLPVIDGFAARLPADMVDDLTAVPGVVAVTPDVSIEPLGIDPALGYDATGDTGSLSSITRIVGAQAMWTAGYTGKGVDVAVIDTGVTRVPGLSANVVDGPDLSFDSQDPALAHLDAYGHGTHMASIIAGNDLAGLAVPSRCSTCLTKSPYTDTTRFVGVAPLARIVNVKVGASDGATDVSQVIAGIDWVVQHAHDPGLNIRVLNLSYGTDSLQPANIDPLSYAVEVAWRHGIVVVVAAGNDGLSNPNLASPASNPTVIAVGGDDPRGTIGASDDVVPWFASHGNPGRPVDVIAPATHVVGLRVPGSYVDQFHPEGLVGSRFVRGSGTSQAAAVTSGVVALLLQRFPTATPDQIKAYLTVSATPLNLLDPKQYEKLAAFFNPLYSGHGIVNVTNGAKDKLPQASLAAAFSTGLGSLEAARGTVHVSVDGVVLQGEQDIFASPWDRSRWTQASATAAAWTGGVWNGNRWTGDGWTGSRWTDATWQATSWTGNRWTDDAWTGSRWTGMTWNGNRWTGDGWNGSRWSSDGWTGNRWSSAGWN